MDEDDLEGAITKNYYEALGIPDQRQVDAFKQYQKIVHYASHMPKLDNVLELGAGFSTVLFAQLGKYRKCKVYSIDMCLDNLWNQVKNTHFYEIVKNNISFLEGSSISKSDFNTFYHNEKSKGHLGGVNFKSIKKNIYKYVNNKFGVRKWKVLREVLGVNDNSEVNLRKIFFSEEGIIFPNEILSIYSQDGDEFDFFRKTSNNEGLLNELISEVNFFDLIFFDSGEFSSYPEWIILKNYIRRGGIAVFHDIFFPKSFKNFLVCAALCADPQWKIIYKDVTTPQGLLMALKIF